MSNKWQVRVPRDRWMGGFVHTFTTKAKALRFIDSWNATEVNSGNSSLTFHRFGPRTYEPCEG